MEVKNKLNRKTVLAIALLATVLTAGIVFGLTVVSNHLTGVSGATPTLTLTGNTTGATFIGDHFHLVVTITNWPVNGGNGVDVTFYNGASSIGLTTSGNGGVASLDWTVNTESWDLYATASF